MHFVIDCENANTQLDLPTARKTAAFKSRKWIAISLAWVMLPAGWSVTSLHAQQPALLKSVAISVPANDAVRIPEQLAETSPQLLTLENLQEMAFQNNPSIARAQALVQAARGNWVQVGLAPNPTVGYSGQQIGSRGLAEQDGVVIGQDIVRGGKLHLNRHVAEQDIMRAQQELAAQQQRVRTDVHITYYQVLAAQRQIDVTTELVQIGDKGLKTADSLFRAKETGRADVLQAQLEVENAEMLLQNARNRHTAAWQRLSAVVGRQDLSQQPLSGDLFMGASDIFWSDILERLKTSSPEIAVAMTNIARARWAYQRALVEPKSNIRIQGLVNARDNGIGGRSDGAIQITMPIPVWNRNQGASTQARYEISAAEKALEQLELDLQNRLAPVFERYSSARNQVERYRTRILPAAQETLELTRASYQAGEIGFINLLTVQRTYFQTNLNYLDSLRELRTSEAEMEGLLLSGSLQSK